MMPMARDIFGRLVRTDLVGRKIPTGLVEVKSGNAMLSELQRRAKSRQSNYEVMWVHPWFF